VADNTATLFSLSPELLKQYAPILFATVKSQSGGLCQFNDVDAHTFKHFAKWLHHQPYFDCELVTKEQIEDDEDFDNDYIEQGPLYDDYEDTTRLSAKMYLFASKYKILQLQKDAVDRLVVCVDINDEPDFSVAAQYVYARTSADHILRKVLVDGFCAERFDERENATSLQAFPKQFLIDVMMRNAHVFNVVDGPLFGMSMHQYHECDNEVVNGERKACFFTHPLVLMGSKKEGYIERSRFWVLKRRG
jgi:hypothetical protein